MTPPSEAYVWIWLLEASDPVVAGRVRRTNDVYRFLYGDSYLARRDAISLFEPELPLRHGWIEPPEGLSMAGCLNDSGPDAWGRKVIDARLSVGRSGAVSVEPDELTYLLESGSNRIGALDFQASPDRFVARADSTTLDELHAAALALQNGEELRPGLAEALVHGTSVGGARPKLVITDAAQQWLAKLTTSADTYPVVKAEALGLELARRVGIDVPAFELTTSLGRDVLLVQRFDRLAGGGRRLVVSGLTMLGLDAFLGARYASYPEMLDVLRSWGANGDNVGRTVFERVVFSIAIGNTDDHARNHAAFWSGTALELTPAYDLCPQPRAGTEARQAMAIGRSGRKDSRFQACVEAAPDYGLTRNQALEIVSRQVDTIRTSWTDACDMARLSAGERKVMLGRQILNPYAFDGL